MSPELSWALNPGILANLALATAVYLWRWRRVRAQMGPRGASVPRLVSFLVGVLMLFTALISPVDGLGEQLFVMHVVQHILLTDFAAVFLLLGLTKAILRPVTARLTAVERRAGPLASPTFAVLLYAGTLGIWHIPALYNTSLENSLVHSLQHMSFFAAAMLFWWHVLSPIRSRQRLEGMGVVFYVGGAKILTGVLASLITWAPVFLYEGYERQERFWGLAPKTDQSLAGSLMMVEEGLVLTLAMAFLFIRMLSESERDESRRERYEVG